LGSPRPALVLDLSHIRLMETRRFLGARGCLPAAAAKTRAFGRLEVELPGPVVLAVGLGGLGGGAALGVPGARGGGPVHGPGLGQPVGQMPRLLHMVKPRYPAQARLANVSGRVLVRFLVDREGLVREASVVEATPAGPFEQSALETVARWRFKPALRRDVPVATWMTLPIRFALEDS